MKNTRWNIGALNKGKPLSEAIKHKISFKIKQGYKEGRIVWNNQKPWPENVKKKISKSKKGSTPWNRGISRTEEEKRKMSAGAKKMWKRRREAV